MNLQGHAPAVRINGVDPRHVDRLERLQAALAKATDPERQVALQREIQRLKAEG